MGNKCYSAKRGAYLPNVDEQPPDTERYNCQGLPLLDFQLSISNMQIRGLPKGAAQQHEYKSVCVQLLVDDALEKTLQNKPLSDTIKWRDSCSAHLRLTEYQLRKRSLVITVFSETRTKVAGLRLNLYQISVGPYHQDFQVNFGSARLARMSLDVKISQLVQIDIRPIEITVLMATEHPGEQFHYTLRSVDESGTEVESQASYNAQIQLFSSRIRQSELVERNADSQRLFERKNSLRRKQSIVLAENQKLHWSIQEAKRLHQSSIPGLSFAVNVGKLASYGIQLMLWKVQSETANVSNTALEEEVQLYAECSTNLSKFFLVEPTLTKVDEWTTIEDRTINYSEKMWKEGKTLGTVNVQYRVILPCFSKQMLVCVRTESGLQAIKPGFTLLETSSGNCPEVKKISELKAGIEQAFMNLNIQQNSNAGGRQRKISGLKCSIIQGLNQVSTLLQIVNTGGKKQFNYRSEEDMQRAQMVMIDLGLKLLEYLNDKDVAVAEACYRTYLQLMTRECLNLTFMKLSPSEQQAIHQAPSIPSLPKPLRERLEVCLKYQSFLYRGLCSALNSLTKSVMDDWQRTFSIIVIGQSFFRVPAFRASYLSILQTSINNAYYEQISQQLQSVKDDALAMFLDWDMHFHQGLAKQPVADENRQLLADALENPEIKGALIQRGTTFYCLVIEVVDSIEALFDGRGDINWRAVPGYSKLVSIFLCEMLTKKLQRYPDRLRQASIRLTRNSELLPMLTRLLLRQTNVYVNLQVFRAIELIEAYFDELKLRGRSCSTFDYKFFYSAIKIVLESEHANVLSRCLCFLYRHYSSFSVAFRRELSMLLLGQMFFKLFLSWSKSVRMVFHSLLAFHINLDCNFTQLQSPPRLDETQANQMAERYHRSLSIVRAALRSFKNECSQKNDSHSSLAYHKQMRQKQIEIRLRKRIRRGSDDYSRELKQKYSLSVLNNQLPLRSNSSLVMEAVTIAELPPLPLPNRQLTISSDEKRRKISAALKLEDLTEPEELARERKKRIVAASTGADAKLQENDLPSKLPYLQLSCAEFAAVEDSFQKLMAPHFKHENAPIVRMKLTIDKAQIRPDDIDDWNG